MSENASPTLRVVIYTEDSLHIAQCVDYDIAAHGKDDDEAIQQFIRAYQGEIAIAYHLGIQPFSNTPRPSAAFDQAWRQAASQRSGRMRKVDIPAFTIRHKDRVDETLPCDFFGHLEIALSQEALV